jgi:hypothetical protein
VEDEQQGTFSDEKSGLYFSVFAFLRSESHGTHEHTLLSLFLRLPEPGGPGSCIYFTREQGSPVIPPGIEFVDLIYTPQTIYHEVSR